jgi:small neutral amino acid transporter SnatA (MarC family)
VLLVVVSHVSELVSVRIRPRELATVILVVAVVAGQIILDAIGIHLHSLKVAGGIILSSSVCKCSSDEWMPK